ncbi:MAG: membrane protein insertion efficiency factor YidD [Chitinophagia bacterium]|jgi:putative membrane protein insertion efficiency factor|nr:membrane protein insertion efficiency factor YidD [Chitinophagia bacterium]
MILSVLDYVLALLAKCLVVFYRLMLQPLVPLGGCRFTPSCSQYMLDSLSRNGGVRGIALGIRRISRCRPGCPGGHDPA